MNSKELSEFYKDKDVFFSLNDYDTFSIASVEAMSAGLIPIVTEETGMSRFIITGENGYIIKYGDTDSLLKIIGVLLKNPELKQKLSIECSKIYSILSWNEIYEGYKNIYKSADR